MSMDEQWARDHIGTVPAAGGCGASYHDERGDVQDCTSVEPCRACLRRRIEQLVAQRGGAVVVPELTDVELSACERLARMCRKSPSLVEGYLDDIKPWEAAEAIEKAATRQAIPADRVLEDGMVGVDREEWEVTSALALRLANWYNGHEINRTIWPPELQRYRTIHSLRAQQAKGE